MDAHDEANRLICRCLSTLAATSPDIYKARTKEYAALVSLQHDEAVRGRQAARRRGRMLMDIEDAIAALFRSRDSGAMEFARELAERYHLDVSDIDPAEYYDDDARADDVAQRHADLRAEAEVL